MLSIKKETVNIYPGRSGFTLPELLITVSIAAVFMFSLYLLYQGGVNSFRKSSNKSEALQGAYILYQNLQTDMAMCIHNNGLPIQVQSTGGGNNNQLSFHVSDPANTTPLRLKTLPVVYLYSPDTMMVTRNGKIVTRGTFEDVQFILEDSDYSTIPPKYGNQILCAVQAVGRHAAANLRQGETPHQGGDRSTFIGSFSIPYKVEREQHPTWYINKTSYPR
jgi:prepilin-type N-terminal cleavage/methylation domain-containing protein